MIKDFSKVYASDIESNNWIDFLMIGLFDGETYHLFNSLDKYLDYLIKTKHDGAKIFFHNGGKFDFLFLVEKLLERGHVKFINKASGILGMIFNYKDKIKLQFLDSYPLLPASLERLIETYNIKHKKIPVDFTVKRKFNDKKLQEHLENDCRALYDILKMTFNNEGFLSLTIASHSLKVFTNDFFKGTLWNVSDKFDKYFRANYYKGGRVEVFKGYGKNLYYYDVNSLYPFVMLQKMPVGTPKKTTTYKKNKIGFYKIQLLQDTNYLISPLSVKTKTGNYYCNGEKGNIFYLISCELEILIKDKIKFKVLSGYYFLESATLFNEYVNYYYHIKETSNGVKRYFAKLMLNSLYGKFGQRLEGQTIEVNTGQGDYPVFDVYNDLLLVDKKRHIRFKGVYIASYITALARTYHFNLMRKIGFKNIWYCDTDSIITNKKIKEGKKIGELKLEAKIKEGVFLLPKTYGFIDNTGKKTVHIKGFSTKDFKYEDLKKLILGTKKQLVKIDKRMLGFKESQKRINNIDKSNGNYLKLVTMEKKLVFNYSRRKIVKNNNYIFTTIPFNYNSIKK